MRDFVAKLAALAATMIDKPSSHIRTGGVGHRDMLPRGHRRGGATTKVMAPCTRCDTCGKSVARMDKHRCLASWHAMPRHGRCVRNGVEVSNLTWRKRHVFGSFEGYE